MDLRATSTPAVARMPTDSRFLFERNVTALLARAAVGDRAAWDRLYAVFGGMISSIARNHGLSPADADDVSQTTWLRLVEHLDRIDQPERVGGWLATTTRRECKRLLQERSTTSLLANDSELERIRDTGAEPDAQLIAEELAQEVSAAYHRLTPRCQRMLGLLTGEPAPSYRELSNLLEMPFGSIGPTRQRCVECLRRLIDSAPAAKHASAARREAAQAPDGLRHGA